MARRNATMITANTALAVSVVAFLGVLALAVVPPTLAVGAHSGPAASAPARPPRAQPLIIGHRGAAGYRPEHTLPGYALAVAQGADYIEADLVPTRDGVLVARHENQLAATTDVAAHPEFADRRRTATVNGHQVTDWFVEDFTLVELKTLRTRARRPAPKTYDGQDTVPTLVEIIDLARTAGAQRNRPVGLYLEAKLPGYFTALGLDPVPLLLAALHRADLDRAGAPVFVESFEVDALRELHTMAPAVAAVQLYWAPPRTATPGNSATSPPPGSAGTTPTTTPPPGPGATASPTDSAATTGSPTGATGASGSSGPSGTGSPSGSVSPSAAAPTPAPPTEAELVEVRQYATGIGLDRVVATAAAIGAAHAAGLLVHVYTFDPTAVAADYQAAFTAGVDGVFTDCPDTAAAARAGTS